MCGSDGKTVTGRVVRQVLLLFVIAAVVRVGWVAARYRTPERSEVLAYPDEDAYWHGARSLAAGDGLGDEFGYRATYMPAYPVFLSMFTGLDRPLWWARIVQALLAASISPVTFLVARKWDRWSRAPESKETESRIALLAGLAATLDPFLVLFSGLLLTESLFAVAAVGAWGLVIGICENRPVACAPGSDKTGPIACASGSDKTGPVASSFAPRATEDRYATGFDSGRSRLCNLAGTLAAGALLWLAVMLRPSAVVLMAAAAVVIVVAGRAAVRRRAAAAAIVVLVVVAGLLPWAARNRAVIGQWRWLTTRGGISLYDGLQPGATGASDLAHTKTMPEVRGLSEVQWDRYFRDQAWTAARQDPVRVLVLAWHKFLRTWSPTPNVQEYCHGLAAAVSGAWMILVLGLAVIGLWARRRAARAWLVLLLPVILVTLLHMVFVGSVRYRVPTMPLVMVLSAAGLDWLIARCRVMMSTSRGL